mmetsp:Transcript_1142/g.3133  ORF Transcript_1142/g.3133 Transcript_1142/m.3133 type:complete len:586 (+) Transcript_1142:1-1758(+)
MGSPDGYDLADKAVVSAASKGGWVLLKNVHLAPAWLHNLEKRLHSIEASKDFRLFLTMEIHSGVPTSLIRQSQVVVYEPPMGVKASLQRSLRSLEPARVDKAPSERARLFLLVAWLHAVVQGRLRYVPLAWSKAYEFSETDQRAALDSVDAWIDMAGAGRSNLPPERIPWNALRTLLTEACYGGRIDNAYDTKALACFVNRFLSPDCYRPGHLLAPGRSEAEGSVVAPEGSKLDAMAAWVKSLAEYETPKWLGLAEDSDLVLRAEQGRLLLSGWLQLQAGIEEDASDEETVAETQPHWAAGVSKTVAEFLELLPTDLKAAKTVATSSSAARRASVSAVSEEGDGPVARFLRTQVVVASALLRRVREQLSAVAAVLDKGEKATNDTRDLTISLAKGTLPANWAAHHPVPPTMSVREWLADLHKRLTHIDDLVTGYFANAQRPPLKIWLGGLFQAEGLFTATRQEKARAEKWPLEILTLRCRCDDGAATAAPGAFVVEHAALQGAKLEGASLTVGREAAVPLPDLHLDWVRDDDQPDTDTRRVMLPVYLNKLRSSVLASVPLPLAQEATAESMYERSAAITLWGGVE